MRITSGEFRGRIIDSPKGNITHPMGDREKLALFNSLVGMGVEFDSLENVLDSFCGSGALGIEAFSRGAKKVTFVDKNLEAVNTVKNNISKLGLQDRAEVNKCNVRNFIAGEANSSGKFDLIFADPPYDHFDLSEFKDLKKILAQDGFLVISHPDEIDLSPLGLIQLSHKKYAAANISIFANCSYA